MRKITTLPGTDLDDVVDPRPDAHRGVDDRDELRRRLDALPYRQRTAIVLRYYEDHSYAQCAVVLGCAEGTVRSLCSRGLAALRLIEDNTVLTIRGEPT